jgi:hypothetical protein
MGGGEAMITPTKRKCEWCGRVALKSALDIHHKDGNHNNNDPSNLLILCATCHRETHEKQRLDPHNTILNFEPQPQTRSNQNHMDIQKPILNCGDTPMIDMRRKR